MVSSNDQIVFYQFVENYSKTIYLVFHTVFHTNELWLNMMLNIFPACGVKVYSLFQQLGRES